MQHMTFRQLGSFHVNFDTPNTYKYTKRLCTYVRGYRMYLCNTQRLMRLAKYTIRPPRTLALRAVYSLSKADRQACCLQCFLLVPAD